MTRWLHAAKFHQGSVTKPTKPTEPRPLDSLSQVLSVASVLSQGDREIPPAEPSVTVMPTMVPEAWCEGYALLAAMDCPTGLEPRRWRQIVLDSSHMIDHWAAIAASLGWDTLSIWGATSNASDDRPKMQGLVASLKGSKIVAMTADAVAIRWNEYRVLRRLRLADEGVVPLWNLTGAPTVKWPGRNQLPSKT